MQIFIKTYFREKDHPFAKSNVNQYLNNSVENSMDVSNSQFLQNTITHKQDIHSLEKNSVFISESKLREYLFKEIESDKKILEMFRVNKLVNSCEKINPSHNNIKSEKNVVLLQN